eukprot:TRINITY_DN78642_c0_g1_i1.p2 TRINITY_DN78642_c0_g1~~TRINITY_DN78642_c0_g1_i1.p2  ORF type:complete len:123 (-),score=9.89 TRINITY_DN78642_c0_g1_i1:218-586(-)
MQRSFSAFGDEFNGQVQHSREFALGWKRPSGHGTQPLSEIKFPGGQYDPEARTDGTSANRTSAAVGKFIASKRKTELQTVCIWISHGVVIDRTSDGQCGKVAERYIVRALIGESMTVTGTLG